MRGWRDRRKAKEQALAQAESFANPEPQFATSFGKSMRRKQKNVPEPKVELDLSSALPDTNDFRMSLMMPGFSARFSMLREQDNPETKIGKAADDSVLFPKRASRMNLFSHNPLTDIAEVDSVRGSFKPPFADGHRSHSFSDGGYASDDGGSIMGRSKPGEGNNLFGGRQKFYRIPASKGAAEAEGIGMGGRHMYEGDVSMSMFQKLRMEARQGRESEDTNERPESMQHTDTEEIDTINSPSTGFSKNRGTTSSTTSAPSNRRTSTAATSVASESPALPQNIAAIQTSSKSSDQTVVADRNGSLHKRLYAANLDQVSPSRRNFREVSEGLSKPPAPSNANPKVAPSLSQSRSASNLVDRYTRPTQVFTPSSCRPASPPPSAGAPPALPPMNQALGDRKGSGSPSDARYNMTTPGSEDEDIMTYASHVQPNDRGKATAMGLFNRPQRQYDEHQFTQRQLQMVEGRNSPAPQPDSSEAVSRHVSNDLHNRSSNSRKSPMSKSQASPMLRKSSETEGRASPLTTSCPEPSPPIPGKPRTKFSATTDVASTVKARAEELIRRQNAELAALEARRQGNEAPLSNTVKRESPPTQAVTNGTFLDTFDVSDEEAEHKSRHQSARSSQPRRAPEAIHPALRDGALDFDFGDAISRSRANARNEENSNSSSSSVTALPQMEHNPYEALPAMTHGSVAPSSHTPNPGQGLSGMIRSHMRDMSDSSVYPPPSPGLPPSLPSETPRAGSIASTTRTWNPPESMHSDPWDLDQLNHNASNGHRGSDANDRTMQMAKKAQQMLGQATALREKSKAQQILGDEAPNMYERPAVGSTWQEDNRKMHHRGASTETQKERDEFDAQIAERRRKVQERMKSANEDGSRPASPGVYGNSPNHGPFSALKQNKSGETSSKAMKMLGISSPPPSVNQVSPRMPPNQLWQEEEERMLQDFERRRKQRTPEGSYDHRRRSPPRDRSAGRSGRSTPHDEERARQRSGTPASGRTSRGDGPRERSTSAASNRSRSRQGNRYRDEPEPAMPGAFPNLPYGDMRSPHMNGPPRRPSGPPELSMDPGQYERSASAMSASRNRSTSRPSPVEPFETRRRGPPLMTGTIASGQPMKSPRPMLSATDPVMPSPRDTLDQAQPSSYSNRMDAHRPFRPPPPGESMMPSPRKAPIPDYSTRRPSSPSPIDQSANTSAVNSPTVNSYASNARSNSGASRTGISGRKKSISKHMISEPTFVSSTSSVPLIDRNNGPDGPTTSPPDLPAMNPRRRVQTNTPSIFGSFGKKTQSREIPPEMSDMSFLENDDYRTSGEKRQRNRLRKSSSEGGSMALKAAKQAMMTGHLESPQVPTFPNRSATNLRDGGMF